MTILGTLMMIAPFAIVAVIRQHDMGKDHYTTMFVWAMWNILSALIIHQGLLP